MDRLAGGLRIYRSNLMESLVGALGDVLSEPLEQTLAPECILVPGRGVAQWLNLELSRRFGVWANALYLYPRNFVSWALEKIAGVPGENLELFDRDRMMWSLFAQLGPLLGAPEFEALSRYVSDDIAGTRYFELCQRIAFTFDRYAVYRPDLLEAWERVAQRSREPLGGAPQLELFDGGGTSSQAWQSVLWRTIATRADTLPIGALERRFVRRLGRGKRLPNLPARICSLGLTHLPPSYTRILVALSAHVPVHLFQLCASSSRPSPAPAQRARPNERRRGNNPLLSSLGALAADFEQVLAGEIEKQGASAEELPLFTTPAGETHLARLQREILWDRAPEPAPAAAADDSIRIHSCHSPMREVEVIHDQLMELLSAERSLEPRDLIVMMPDVEVYAPLIEAVFRRDKSDPCRIPFTIADRAASRSAPVADALERLFDLCDQRFTISQVLDLLSREVVARRFDLTPRDVEQVGRWISDANVRWGIDAQHRAEHGHPASDANTWRLGLTRLLLGYAVHTTEPTLVFDVLPARAPEGGEAAALGNLAKFIEALFLHTAALARAHSTAEWQAVVNDAAEALLVSDAENAWQHQELRAALAALTERAAGAGYAEQVPSRAFARLLFDALDAARPGRGFMLGGVTFCSMVPLRTIPFKVVCLLGLSDGEFPRRDIHSDFDLMESGPLGPRLGDRSVRSEDRYLFLEAVLSARERLIITYTGQSIRDNAPLAPSVVLRELLDCLERWAKARENDAGAPEWLVRHPLQAFSRRYFDGSDPKLFSYAEPPHPGKIRHGSLLGPQFFERPLPAPATGALAIAELIRFFENPTRALLEQRLDLSLHDRTLELLDREPQELSPLEKYKSGDDLLELMLRQLPLAEAKRLLERSGDLPLGAPGELSFLAISASAVAIAERVLEARQRGVRPPLGVDAELPSGRRLVGTLDGIVGDGVLDHQFARVQAKHLLRAWIRHLVYCWRAGSSNVKSTLIGRPEDAEGVRCHEFGAVSEPERHLTALLEYHDEGQRQPLLLFPSVSLIYAQSLRAKSNAERDVSRKLQRRWEQELERDAHLGRIYGQDRLLDEVRPLAADQASFEQLAVEIFEPLLDHLSPTGSER